MAARKSGTGRFGKEPTTKPGHKGARSRPSRETEIDKRKRAEAKTLPPPKRERADSAPPPSKEAKGRTGNAKKSRRGRGEPPSSRPVARVDEVTADLSRDPRRED